jgi:ribosomal-protein-alanine N-acetyltransferase
MNLSIDHKLETPRCILRYPNRTDSVRLLSAFGSKDFPSYVPLGRIGSIEQVIDWIEGSHKRWNTGQGYTWTAERKCDRLVVGQVSLVQLGKSSTWSLAFWTHPDCWGQGYATEIARSAVECAFRELLATKVWAAAAKRNKGSLRVLQKLGLKCLGENNEGYRIDDETIPTKEFSLELVDLDGLER